MASPGTGLRQRVRAKVKHVFRVMGCQFDYRKVRYRGIAKNGAQVFRCLRSPICISPAADFVRMKAIGAKTAKLRRHRTDAPASSRAIQRFPLSSGAEVANVRVADPERRRRRIFIDYLRNGPGTTAVGIIRLAHDRACRLQIQSSGGRWRIASSQTLFTMSHPLRKSGWTR